MNTDSRATFAYRVPPRPAGDAQHCHACRFNTAPTIPERLRVPPLHTESHLDQRTTPRCAMFADSFPSDYFTTDAHASLATTISPQLKGSFQTCHICNTNPAPTTTAQLRAPPLHTESRPGQQAMPRCVMLADSTPSRPSQNDSVCHPCTPNLIQATERTPTSHSEIQIARQAIQQLAEASCLQLQSPADQYRQIQVPSLQLCSVTDHRRASLCVTFATPTSH